MKWWVGRAGWWWDWRVRKDEPSWGSTHDTWCWRLNLGESGKDWGDRGDRSLGLGWWGNCGTTSEREVWFGGIWQPLQETCCRWGNGVPTALWLLSYILDLREGILWGWILISPLLPWPWCHRGESTVSQPSPIQPTWIRVLAGVLGSDWDW
jgi:hypothetical protein